MSRLKKRMIESITKRINKDKKVVHVCQRNDYWAVDRGDEEECYECGMSTRECYLFLKGFKNGVDITKEEEACRNW